MVKGRKKLTLSIDFLYITFGCLVAGTAIDIFLIPYKIAPGGITGIATVIFYLTNSRIPVGAIILLLNVPLLISSMKLIGKSFFYKTIYGTIMLSVFIDVLEPFTKMFADNYLRNLADFSAGSDLLLYSIFGGTMMGIGLGIVFRAGSTTGGTDLAAQLVHHYLPYFTVGQILMVIDAIVVVFAAVAFKSFLLGLYAIVTIFISSRLIDTVLVGVDYAKAVFIISDKSELISQKIITDIDRGVTGLKGTGMYTGTDKQVLLCVLDHTQIPRLKSLVKSIDGEAFVIMTDVREVFGEGFVSRE